MFVPLSDTNPLRSINFQVVTVLLILANIVVFVLQMAPMSPGMVASFAVVPRELLGDPGVVVPSMDAIAIPEFYTLISYMFLHADVFHLAGNMLFLWVFGDNVEDAMGHFRFLIFYILCGVGGGLAHALMVPTSASPLVGASGAVAGVIAAYLMLHPRVRVWVLAFNIFPIQLTAALLLGFWIVTQVVMVLVPQVGPTAWWAHIGGFVIGAILIVFMKKPEFSLFDRDLGSA
ncbi:MAG: rhomboid family intramembrane serine protease [Hyphomicrobiaceae bacterium]